MAQDNDKKLVNVKGMGVVAFPKGMEDHHIAAAIQKHQSTASPSKESPNVELPAPVERVMNAIGVNFVNGKPFKGYGGRPVISSVAEHEPHNIEINDPKRFAQAPVQVSGHEIIHLWRNNLPFPTQKSALPVDPKNPYSLDKLDEWRAKGYNLSNIPEESAAQIVTQYIADPRQRAKLQVWLDDLNSIPMSVMEMTGPNDKTINTTPRVPAPPIEAYYNPTQLINEAKKRKP